MKTKSIISIIEVVLFLVILTSLTYAATLTRTTQTTVQPSQQFSVTYTANDPIKWFVAWTETISGGCTPSSYVDFMISETGGSKSVQNNFTAPSSGSCIFSGYYEFADLNQVNFPQLTVTVNATCISQCAGRNCGDDGCGGICPPGCSAGYVCNETIGNCELCIPDNNVCLNKNCGDFVNGTCGDVSCGSCSSGYSCSAGNCASTGGNGGGGGGGGGNGDGNAGGVSTACTNECSSGARECVEKGYRICSNYDYDNCLEWSDVAKCGSGKTCSNGNCITCASDWSCEDWVECINNEQTRICTDLNNCEEDKTETQSCISDVLGWIFWIVLLIIGIIILGIIIYLIYKREKGNIQELKKTIKEKEEIK